MSMSMSKLKAEAETELPGKNLKRINEDNTPGLILDENVWFDHVFVCLTSSHLILLGLTCKYFHRLVTEFFECRVPVLNKRFEERGSKFQIRRELCAHHLAPYYPRQLAYCEKELKLTAKNAYIGAIKAGDLSYLQANKFYMECFDWHLCLRAAIKFKRHSVFSDHIEDKQYPWYGHLDRLFRFCAECGNMIAFHILQKKYPLPCQSVVNLQILGEIACQYGHYAMFEYLVQLASEQGRDQARFLTRTMLLNCVSAGQEEILRFIFSFSSELRDSSPIREAAVRIAIFSNKMRICQILVEEYGALIHSSYYIIAAQMGNIEAIQYMLLRGIPKAQEACEEAANQDRLPCLKFLHEQGFPWDSDTLRLAIKKNTSIECLRYAFENGCRPSEGNGLLLRAIYLENLEAVRYCVEVMGQPLTPELWEYARSDSVLLYLIRMNCPKRGR